MYIQPNSTIKLYKNVPLDTTYEHTLWFDNVSAQNNYFHNNSAILLQTFDGQTYQRVVKGEMTLGVNAESIYTCNYLAFRNTAFGAKWFYAFVTSVEYVSNTASKLTFEIDVMQTYLFDVTLKECFVEREHSAYDYVGSNIVTENIDIGPIICNAISKTGHFDSYVAVIASAHSSNGSTTGGYKGGLFSGVNYIPCLIDNPEQVQNALDYLKLLVDANKQDSVVSIFLMPSKFYPTDSHVSVQVNKVAKNTNLHGYTPKNKKLLTYPYNYLQVECGNNSANYRYEWFSTDTCNFAMFGTISCNPQISLQPQGYNGVDSDSFNQNEQLVMDGFPQVAWSIDSFRAWLAQDASGSAINGIASVASLLTGALTGNIGMTTSGALGVAGNANSMLNALNRSPQASGTNSGTIDVANRDKDFYFRQMQVTQEYARMIDEYFDKFGYATREVKKPNRNVRKQWTYTKTNGCIVVGNAPSDDVRRICEIYDKGITFWKNANNVGNYELDNSPV